MFQEPHLVTEVRAALEIGPLVSEANSGLLLSEMSYQLPAGIRTAMLLEERLWDEQQCSQQLFPFFPGSGPGNFG